MRKFTFDPTKATSGSVNVQLPVGRMKIKFMNHSPANLTLSFPNGDTAALVSLTQREFSRDLNSPNINWSVDSYAGSITPGLSLVVVEAYELREDFVRVSGLPAVAAPNLLYFNDQEIAGSHPSAITIPLIAGQLFYLTRIEYSADAASVVDTIRVNVQNGKFLADSFSHIIQWSLTHGTTDSTNFAYAFPTPYVQNASNIAVTVNSGASANTPAHFLTAWGYYL